MDRELELIDAISERIEDIQKMFSELREIVQNKNMSTAHNSSEIMSADEKYSDVKSVENSEENNKLEEKIRAVFRDANLFSGIDRTVKS